MFSANLQVSFSCRQSRYISNREFLCPYRHALEKKVHNANLENTELTFPKMAHISECKEYDLLKNIVT